MNRDLLLISLVFAVIFLLGMQVMADTSSDMSLQSPEEEFVIVIKPLPSSKLALIEKDGPPAKATASLAQSSEENEFQIKIHPIAENRPVEH